jgi:hypothetical protein
MPAPGDLVDTAVSFDHSFHHFGFIANQTIIRLAYTMTGRITISIWTGQGDVECILQLLGDATIKFHEQSLLTHAFDS